MGTRCLCLAWLSILVAGCGGGGSPAEDLVGMYQVTTHTENEASCDVQGAAVEEDPYFRLSAQDVFGYTVLVLDTCTSADPTSCTDLGVFSSFNQQGGEWVQEMSVSSGGGSYGPCLLTWMRGTLSEAAGTVTIERRTYSEEDTLTEEECDPDTAEARGDSMPCTRYEVLAGARLP